MSIEHPRSPGEPQAAPVPDAAVQPFACSLTAPGSTSGPPAALPSAQPRTLMRRGLGLAGSVLRILLIVAGLWLFAVLIAIVLYRKLDPPFTMLTAAAKLSGQRVQQTWVPLEEIAPSLVRAVILSEDTGFCRHPGVSLGEIEKAMERAKDGVPRGASTISMQLTKNLFLWPHRSYVRKALEIPLTLVMELVIPKRRILEMYLNVAQLGPNVFGAEAAARYHFRKAASRLTEQEAALMAATLPAPSTRRPGRPSPVLIRLGKNLEARMRVAGARAASCISAE